jgi:hypothetical protein
MPTPVDPISRAIVVPAAFGTDAPAAGVSPAEFAAVFRHYSATHLDAPREDDAVRISHINMGLRVVGTMFVDDAGGRSWWAY